MQYHLSSFLKVSMSTLKYRIYKNILLCSIY
jgi:hypothetical protein